MSLRKVLSGFPVALEDMLWPPRCVFCKTRARSSRELHDGFCAYCWEQLPWIREDFCLRCGVPLPEHATATAQKLCRACETKSWHFTWARSVLIHQDIAQELLQRWKLEGEEFLGTHLAHLFSELEDERLSLCLEQNPLISAIPMDPLRKLWRGYDTAWELARVFAKIHGLKAQKLLKRAVYRERQLHRNVALRKADWSGAFSFNQAFVKSIQTRPVILIDDVMTTGSTLNAAAKVLKKAACPLVVAITLARET